MFRTMDTASEKDGGLGKKKKKMKSDRQGRKLFLRLSAKVTAALKIPFQLFSLPTTFRKWTRSPNDGLLSATVAGSVDKLTCRNTNVTSVWLVAGVQSQPSDHVRGGGGTVRRCYEHFHTHTARLPPKNM